MTRDDRQRFSIQPSRSGMLPPAMADLVPQIDAQGFPASALLGSFLSDAGGEDPRRTFALVDRCLSSWIEHMTQMDDMVLIDGLDDAWLRIRAQRQQLLERLVCLRSRLRSVEPADPRGDRQH